MRHHHGFLWLLGVLLVVAVVPAGGGLAERGGTMPTTPLGRPSTATSPVPPTQPASSTITTITATTRPSTTVPTSAPPPSTPPGGQVVYRGDPTRRLVALTFDAGSDTVYTAEILDALAREGIRATFGLTGRWAEQNPDLVRRVAAEGHQVVNHSYDHPSFSGRSTGTTPLTAGERADQLVRADRAIAAAIGRGTAPWWRPPYGDIDDGVVADAAAAGWPRTLMWTVDSLGWKGIGADAVVARCLAGAEPGAIILLHVGAASDDADALPDLLAVSEPAGTALPPPPRPPGDDRRRGGTNPLRPDPACDRLPLETPGTPRRRR